MKRRESPPPMEDVKRLFDQPPPIAPDAEVALLGGIILDGGMIPEVLDHVRDGSAFHSARHAMIFDACVAIYDSTGHLDLVQLIERLRASDALSDVGDEYLAELAERCASPVVAPHHAKVVASAARLRRLIDVCGQGLWDAYHAGPIDTGGDRRALDAAMAGLFAIASDEPGAKAADLASLLEATYEKIAEREGAPTGLRTGLIDVDDLLGGLRDGDLIILAARPSMGKTALALNIAEGVALSGVPVAVFSMEMGREQVAERVLCSRGGVDSHRLRRNALRDEDYANLMAACGEMRTAKIMVDDTPGMTPLQLRSRARQLKHESCIGLVIIDYLQLMHDPTTGRESRQVEVSSISRQMKALAREIKTPVICLSQLNRMAEQREGHRPRLSDLRESGAIEQDADTVALLHREAYYHRDDPDWIAEHPEKLTLAELIVAKQRNGPVGTVELEWDGKSTRFRNREWRHGRHTEAA